MYVNRYRNWCADVVMRVYTHNKHRTPVQELIHMHAAAYPLGEAMLEALGAFREPAPVQHHPTGCRFPLVASFRGRKTSLKAGTRRCVATFRGRKTDLKAGPRRCLPTVWRQLVGPKTRLGKTNQNKNTPKRDFWRVLFGLNSCAGFSSCVSSPITVLSASHPDIAHSQSNMDFCFYM